MALARKAKSVGLMTAFQSRKWNRRLRQKNSRSAGARLLFPAQLHFPTLQGALLAARRSVSFAAAFGGHLPTRFENATPTFATQLASRPRARRFFPKPAADDHRTVLSFPPPQPSDLGRVRFATRLVNHHHVCVCISRRVGVAIWRVRRGWRMARTRVLRGPPLDWVTTHDLIHCPPFPFC